DRPRQPVELHNFGDELVRDALDAVMPDLISGRKRRRFARLDRVHRSLESGGRKTFGDPRDRPALADAGLVRVGPQSHWGELAQQFRAGPVTVRADIVVIGELSRQIGPEFGSIGFAARKRHPEAPFLAAYKIQISTEGAK